MDVTAGRENFEDGRGNMEAYCVKCKEKREVKDPVQVTTKNGRPAVKGTCPVCGSKVCRIGAAK